MKTPHFFKAKSKIGLVHNPARQEESNDGVEDGSDFILAEKFLKNYPNSLIDNFEFSKPEKIEDNYWGVLAKELFMFKQLIVEKFIEGEIQVVIGGDNCVSFSSILGLIERVGNAKKVGYIQFDSHGDMNSFRGSESKNFHGMYMRPFFTTFDVPEIEYLVPQKLHSSQALFFGDLHLDGDEEEFFKEKKFRQIRRDEFFENKKKITEYLINFLATYPYIHVNFDVDVFYEEIFPATGISEDGKWMFNEIEFLLRIISEHPNVSFDLSEFNPYKKEALKCNKICQQILNLICTPINSSFLYCN